MLIYPSLILYFQKTIWNIINRCVQLFFSLSFLAAESDLYAGSAVPALSPQGSQHGGWSDGGASPWQRLRLRAWAAPPGPETDTSRAALCHTRPDQCSLNSQCWELATHAITVYLGVGPSLGLNSFPCFLELISFNSTIVSPVIYTRKYHQDTLL